jgi:hypothetical protein
MTIQRADAGRLELGSRVTHMPHPHRATPAAPRHTRTTPTPTPSRRFPNAAQVLDAFVAGARPTHDHAAEEQHMSGIAARGWGLGRVVA